MMSPRILAPHVLRLLAAAQYRGRPMTLQDLVDRLKIRRVDLRHTLTAMDQQGLLNVLTLKLTLQGFAVGTALRTRKLPAIPRQTPAKQEEASETTTPTTPTTSRRIVAA